MPLVTDWIMVGITAAYVIATIVICIFNWKSTRTSNAQIEESKRQHEETKRLEAMPFLYFEIPMEYQPPRFEMDLPISKDITGRTYTIVFVKNMGNSTAANIEYDWSCDGFIRKGLFPSRAMMKSDSDYIQLFLQHEPSERRTTKGSLGLFYNDMLGNRYRQVIQLGISNNKVTGIKVDFPEYKGRAITEQVEEK